MTYFLAKSFGTDVVKNLDFMSRPGIYWRWNSTLFNGVHFGTDLAAINCFLKGGFHDFAHCIDFIMRGKARRVTSHGLDFKRHWEEYVPYFNLFDGEPKSGQMIACEARAFALQAFLMEKEIGFIVDDVDYDDLEKATADGLLDHIPPAKDPGIHYPKREHMILTSMSVEDFAHAQAHLVLDFKDMWAFLRERGHDPMAQEYAETKRLAKSEFETLILAEYNRLKNPFAEKRVSRAITALGERLRRFHKSSSFIPGEDVYGMRPRIMRAEVSQ
ncbi:hypothetical protein RYA05_00640 [Pseudomonas syringae pv. actinidiae]|nr:hypothetical protein [Pseudomonas syringae pv. actinidiae]